MRPGVNIYGYAHAESGVGEVTRLLVSSVREAGMDYSVVPFTSTLSRQQSEFADFGSKDPRFDVNIIGVNADQMDHFVEHFGREALDGRYNIALWAWEVEDFPDWMAATARWVDEIWAISSFSAAAIARKVDVPVYPFSLPIRTPEPQVRSRFEARPPGEFPVPVLLRFRQRLRTQESARGRRGLRVSLPGRAGSPPRHQGD